MLKAPKTLVKTELKQLLSASEDNKNTGGGKKTLAAPEMFQTKVCFQTELHFDWQETCFIFYYEQTPYSWNRFSWNEATALLMFLYINQICWKNWEEKVKMEKGKGQKLSMVRLQNKNPNKLQLQL